MCFNKNIIIGRDNFITISDNETRNTFWSRDIVAMSRKLSRAPALLVLITGRYLSDLSGLVVASDECDSVRVPHL